MNPLPDRTVVIGLVATLGIVFALIFWFVRLAPSQEAPLLWREGPGLRPPAQQGRPTPGPIRTPTGDRAPAELI
ncbi:MAG: hypothetical protein ACKO5M_02365 [Vulcanococcus sp.]